MGKAKQKDDKKKGDEELKVEDEDDLIELDHSLIRNQLKEEKVLLLLGYLASLANGLLPLLFYVIMGGIVDTLAETTSVAKLEENIIYYSLLMFVVAGGSGLISFVKSVTLTPVSTRISNRLRQALFNAISHQEIGYFDKNNTGVLLGFLAEEIQHIEGAYTDKIPLFLGHISMGLVGLILAFVFSWNMTLVLLAIIPVVGLAMGVQAKITNKFTLRIKEAHQKGIATAEEVLANVRTVRAFAGEDKEKLRYNSNLSSVTALAIKKGLGQGFSTGLVSLLIWGLATVAFWYGGFLVSEGTITIGAMIKVFGMVIFAGMGLGQGFQQMPPIMQGRQSEKVILKIMCRTPKINFSGGSKLDKIVGNISFQNITFAYPTRKNQIVLDNFSIDLKAGKSVALVGPSGSGKSTIVGLIERFYDPLQGTILIDGADVKTLDPQWLHQQIGIVTQEPVLFATSIKINIKYGKEHATDEEVIAAAKTANAHDFIMSLPNGYDTIIGERGASLSGGQKQRVAIARAVLKDPPVLLLDEATSALDTESESLVQDALNKLMIGRTSIIIAHRLSTIQHADLILVLRKGVIVERGNHNELMHIPNGLYKIMATRQNLGLEMMDDLMDDVQDDHNNNNTSGDKGGNDDNNTISLVN